MTFETLFLADEVIWALVFFGLGLFPLLFLDYFHVLRGLWTSLLLVCGFLEASTLTFALTLLWFLGSLFSFQRHCLAVLARDVSHRFFNVPGTSHVPCPVPL